MSIHAFGLTLVVAAAALALWIMTRYTQFGPRSLLWAAVHVVIAYALLRLVPVFLNVTNWTGIPHAPYVQIFGVVLPLLVYSFLSGGWVTRIAVGLLRR